jgi:hypothetical protein
LKPSSPCELKEGFLGIAKNYLSKNLNIPLSKNERTNSWQQKEFQLNMGSMD